MIVVVQDANILIDLYEAGLLGPFFKLGFENHSTDLVLNEIEQPVHKYVKNGLIRQHALTPEHLEQIFDFQSVSANGISLPDCSVLWLTKELGNDTRLLTGDGKLRQVAEKERIKVHGLLWILDHLVEEKIVSGKSMSDKLEELIIMGSRLPENECQKRILLWRQSDT